MRTWTNLAWPDDPYRTGQQLYRRAGGRLAAFTTWPPGLAGQAAPAAAAIVYLPLHRTRAVKVTGQTLTFGFRAATAAGPAEVPAVAEVADLDLMQARRHAAVLAGCRLGKDLAALLAAGGVTGRRGLAAVAGEWVDRRPPPGRAALFDCDLDLPGGLALGQACEQAGISLMTTVGTRGDDWDPAARAVERALTVALLCARHQGRYEWDGILDTRTVMASSAWDCLPWPAAGTPGAEAAVAAAHRQHQ